jgi:hypothetical protein
LLDHAADPNIEDFEGRTLAEWREKEAVKEASQKPESGRSRGNTDRKEAKGKEKGFTPLHNAVAYGYVSIFFMHTLELILIADINVWYLNSFRVVLAWTLKGHKVFILQHIIQHTIINHFFLLNYIGMTPLHISAITGEMECAHLFVMGGADIQQSNASKVTPLHLAIKHSQLELAALLLKRGASVNVGDKVRFFVFLCLCFLS